MTNSSMIAEKVKRILAQKLDIESSSLTRQTRLAEDLGVDSFGAVELMFEIEEAFGLKIPDSEIEHVRTVSDIVDYIETWTKTNPKS